MAAFGLAGGAGDGAGNGAALDPPNTSSKSTDWLEDDAAAAEDDEGAL